MRVENDEILERYKKRQKTERREKRVKEKR